MVAELHAHSEATALSLMLAVIASSDTPLLLLDGELRVVAASASFCRTFEIAPASVPRQLVTELGDGEWDLPQLVSDLQIETAIDPMHPDFRKCGHLGC